MVYVKGTLGHTGKRPRNTKPHWGYGEKNGPDTWPGVCHSGKHQSPINIKPSSAIEITLPPFEFGEYYTQKIFLEAENNGHTLEVKPSNKSLQPLLRGGGLEDDFIFQQLHFHWGSEHLIQGKRAALEMHLVHLNSKYESVEDAIKKDDGIAVVSVLYYENKLTKPVIENFFKKALEDIEDSSNVTPGAHSKSEEIYNNSPFNQYALRDLLPDNTDTWYRYDGSLTTPGCEEAVKWTVLENRLPISKEVLNSLRDLKNKEGMELEKNYRPVQDLNDRKVYIRIDTSEEESNEIPQIEDNDDDDEEEDINNTAKTLPINLIVVYIYHIYNIVN